MLKLRRAPFLASLLLLTGCGSGDKGDYAQYFNLVRQGFSQSLSGDVTREQAAAISYASMGYRINGSREAIIILATDTGGDLLWTSASHVVLVTHDGRLKRSVGLPHDLGGQTTKEPDGVPPPASALKGNSQYHREEDFPDLSLYGVSLVCSLSRIGPQTIRILQQPIATVQVAERCNASTPRWSFTDNFWVDPRSGFTWRSQQHIHPGGDMVETEILRPPG